MPTPSHSFVRGNTMEPITMRIDNDKTTLPGIQELFPGLRDLPGVQGNRKRRKDFPRPHPSPLHAVDIHERRCFTPNPPMLAPHQTYSRTHHPDDDDEPPVQRSSFATLNKAFPGTSNPSYELRYSRNGHNSLRPSHGSPEDLQRPRSGESAYQSYRRADQTFSYQLEDEDASERRPEVCRTVCTDSSPAHGPGQLFQTTRPRGGSITSVGSDTSSRPSTASNRMPPSRYKCSYCPKRFSRPSSLRIHENSHTGAKPFECPETGCGRHFSVMSNMRRHQKTHRPKQQSDGMLVDSDDFSGGEEMESGVIPSPSNGVTPSISYTNQSPSASPHKGVMYARVGSDPRHRASTDNTGNVSKYNYNRFLRADTSQ